MIEKFDFNDVLIQPDVLSDITSRSECEVKYSTANGYYLPLMTAPMDTVINLDNIDKFIENNIIPILPRTIKIEDYIKFIDSNAYSDKYNSVFVSVGLDEFEKLIESPYYQIEKYFFKNILIDIANGHMQKIIDVCKKAKNINPKIKIMVGNIANPETYRKYAEAQCVDYIRCGIGNGGGCLTTKSTFLGYPMASLISEIFSVKNDLITKNGMCYKTPIIVADGGMKEYGDIIMSLALGADYVMCGSIFNKAIESAGDIYLFKVKVNRKFGIWLFKNGFKKYLRKYFRGMSTKEAQKAINPNAVKLKTSEGVIRYRKIEYTLDGWTDNFKSYLATIMSYCNCKYISGFIGKPTINRITNNAYKRFDK